MAVRVLLVDDHEIMREGLRAILAKEPTLRVVGEAATGRDAVRQAAELRPDLVIMDVVMRDLNGVDATRRIRAEHPHAQIVALSSHAERRYVTAILRAGAGAYVVKANAYGELRQAIQAVLSGRSFLCQESAAVVVSEVRSPSAAEDSVWELLGAREREVLQMVAEGHSSGEIGARLHIATSTVETHRRNLMRKLGLHSVADLTRYAIREGLVTAEA